MVVTIKSYFSNPEIKSTETHSHSHKQDKDQHIDKESKDELTKLIETESMSEFDKLPFIHQSTILIQNGQLNEFKILVNKNPNIKLAINSSSKEDGRTLLTRASFGGSLAIIKYIVEDLGADINVADSEEITPIMESVSSENYEVSKYLIDSGANIHATNKLGADALTMALSGSNTLLVRDLLNKGANPNHKWNKKNMSHLMLSSRNGHFKTTQMLLAAGANINDVDNNQNTAIHYASTQGFKKIVELLIDKGSKTNKKNNLGKTAKDLARENNFKDIADLIP